MLPNVLLQAQILKPTAVITIDQLHVNEYCGISVTSLLSRK